MKLLFLGGIQAQNYSCGTKILEIDCGYLELCDEIEVLPIVGDNIMLECISGGVEGLVG
jgi:hypothetical protein